jgi:2-haloacid dehalogenase
VTPDARWATFDCYGTLVDWESGIARTLADLWPDADAGELLAAYHDIEPTVQREEPGLSYREVMARCLRGLAALEGLHLDDGDVGALGDSLPDWPFFPEVPGELGRLRAEGWRLGILSNTDPDLLAASIAAMGVKIDLSITAGAIGSYKPAVRHWERFFDESGADRGRYVHIAQSAFHDLAPCAELDLPAVWINRLGESSALPRAGEVPDLVGLAEVLGGIVPSE